MGKIKRIKWTYEECRELLVDKDTMTPWQLERKYRRTSQSIRMRIHRLGAMGLNSVVDFDAAFKDKKPSNALRIPDFSYKPLVVSDSIANPVQEIVDKLNILGLSGQIIINFGGK